MDVALIREGKHFEGENTLDSGHSLLNQEKFQYPQYPIPAEAHAPALRTGARQNFQGALCLGYLLR